MRARWKTIKAIVGTVYRSNKVYLITGLALVILLSLQSNANIILSKYIVNAIGDQDRKLAITAIVITFTLQVAFMLMQSYKTIMDVRASENFNIQHQKKIMKLLERIPLLDKENARFQQMVDMWKSYSGKYLETTNGLITMVQLFLTMGISTFYLLSSYWVLGVLALVISVARGWLDIRNIPKRLRLNHELNSLNHKQQYVYGVLCSSESQKELMILKAYSYLIGKWERLKHDSKSVRLKLEKTNMHGFVLGEALSSGTLLLVSLTVCYMVFGSKLTMGDYVTIPLMFSLIESSAKRIFLTLSKIEENQRYIGSFNDETATLREPAPERKPFQFNQLLQVKNLTFQYPNQTTPALQNINLTVKQGEKVVILGDNAAGKSTLMKLLLGLYRAPAGTVFYDGQSQEDVEVESLWANASVVFQDFTRYMLTVSENVGLGDVANIHDEKRIQELLNKVGLDISKMDAGIHAKLGYLDEQAINLSGGQWQRLAMARAFFKNSDFLVFDEPTSAIDPLSELEFFNTLLAMSKEKTLFIISHRISIASKADKIVMMSGGEIKETGSHYELIKRRGYYYDMWMKQKEWYHITEQEVV
ncbi:ABC transporter related protein [Paenibacillus curdlanolyticus YK9]|uniref:ABC transporter related protein n=1 Tax=Paenibacillus curdlanolyticus YK9 TaxID=717606 RepID=E0I912_9BACL|nr:ABC transporter ATP-binding protein [Paenibacillus curdlanolyticus]EFM10896.1 ABC transporter related protein [Paenibacillus curdlanolyticus YK9]